MHFGDATMKYFYFDSETQNRVESPAAIEGRVGDIQATWESLSRQRGSFLGVRLPSGVAVQFMWDDADSVVIDVPVPERRGSLTKSSSFEECKDAISHVCSGGDPVAISGLAIVAW
jgi:hypothetical protein